MELKQTIRDYLAWQDACPSVFHVGEAISAKLAQAGFTRLLIQDQNWHLEAGGRYYVRHPDEKAFVAFVVGAKSPQQKGFSLLAAHTDSPVLRLKMNPVKEGPGFVRLATQLHGGLIQRSWLDRPLILAGKVYWTSQSSQEVVWDLDHHLPLLHQSLVRSAKPIAVIPDLAIHLDRSKNESGAINPEEMLAAVIGTSLSESLTPHRFDTMLSQFFGFSPEQEICGFDLTLAPYHPHMLVGHDESLILGPRHDDLAMSFAGLCAITSLPGDFVPPRTAALLLVDAEETGSKTVSGAESTFVRDILEKICRQHPAAEPLEDISQAFALSFLVSADMAHGLHPAHPEKHDTNHKPLLNRGLVIKENASDRYATSGYTAAIFRKLCEAAKVPVQHFVNRQDLACGSTIGPILAANLNCQTVDVGTAMWGMHSSGETMGAYDLFYAAQVFQTFFTAGARSF